MTTFTGFVIGRQCPHIYFIVKQDYIYIGETQCELPKRWGSHLSKGSFWKNLKKVDEDILFDNNLPTHFFGFSCEEINEWEHSSTQRNLTQHLEHLLHIEVGKNVDFSDHQIISNTVRTAPNIYDYTPAIDLARSIVTEFYHKYSLSKDSQTAICPSILP